MISSSSSRLDVLPIAFNLMYVCVCRFTNLWVALRARLRTLKSRPRKSCLSGEEIIRARTNINAFG